MHASRRAVGAHIEHDGHAWADAWALGTEIANIFPSIVHGVSLAAEADADADADADSGGGSGGGRGGGGSSDEAEQERFCCHQPLHLLAAIINKCLARRSRSECTAERATARRRRSSSGCAETRRRRRRRRRPARASCSRPASPVHSCTPWRGVNRRERTRLVPLAAAPPPRRPPVPLRRRARLQRAADARLPAPRLPAPRFPDRRRRRERRERRERGFRAERRRAAAAPRRAVR